MSGCEDRSSWSGGPHSAACAVTPTGSMIPSRRYSDSNKVVINVGGVRYETYKSTLKNVPDTRLAWLTETKSQNTDYDAVTGEYFFDRHPGIFVMILNYYRTGKLHAPSDLCGPIFEAELEYWGIDEKQIEPCCWMNYISHKEAQKTLDEMDGADTESEEENDEVSRIATIFGIEEAPPDQNCWQRWRPKIWAILEDPYSSRLAKVITSVSLLFIVISITAFCLETVCYVREPISEHGNTGAVPITHIRNQSQPVAAFAYLEYVYMAFFTLEFVLRVLFCPDKKKFCKEILNWVDLFSILPFYMEYIVIIIDPSIQSYQIQFLKLFRLIRIFRIFKLTRHFSGIKILSHTLKASARELVLLILILFLGILIFATLIYYAELLDENPNDPSSFWNIPRGFWWAVVTMTTLGYGDIVPKTPYGYIVGALCAMCGVLMIALPVPVIVNNFAMYYTHAQAKLKLPKKKKNPFIGFADPLRCQGGFGVPSECPGSEFSSRVPTPDTSCQYSAECNNNPDKEGNEDSLEDSGDSEMAKVNGSTNASAASATGEHTAITVTFTDEVVAPSTPPQLQVPQSFPRMRVDSMSRRNPLGRRLSLLPNGGHMPPPNLGDEHIKENGHSGRRRTNILQLPEVGV
ncbi:potassium voltage-gated channel subfamily C member 1-like [Lingula anatina]|uniref:Potassium voltage-gated channel subfamily C member 1-like n=1 Tax=Lingula anatina TaxID=7574 RepID=A0A2R2MQY6_LINAN|nr:potassium voltage-gated channel subfamily C member 1-like [Lingula anatina]|eukprot:XP_023932661.1 potassium voltage-gated channel subfamily C member 1-like [Lingula anatina]